MRDEEHLGWTRGAEEYRKRTGQWISRDTFKRRYLEAKGAPEPKPIKVVEPKVIIKSRLERFTEEWEQKLKEL